MAEPFEIDQLHYDVDLRAKYNQADRDDMASKGQALSDGSYPIKDAEDLHNAIHAVGRGGASHNAIRAHIIARAKALGMSDQIPDNWAADGSLKQANALPSVERRKAWASELKGLEHREFNVADMELRAADDGSALHLTGYASMTETPYDVGFYTETIKRGAFKQTLGQKPDVQLLVNHEGLPLARTTSGTLRLAEDERGLKVEADLDPERTDVQNLARAMQRGDIDQMSFAFQATDQDWNDDYTARSIKSVSIHRGDVSVVNQGASPTTQANLRSADAIQRVRAMGGPEAVLEMLEDFQAIWLMTSEERAGAKFAAATLETLNGLLEAVQTIDDLTDTWTPRLAGLLGKPNPDTDAPSSASNGSGTANNDPPHVGSSADGSSRAIADKSREQRQRLAALRKGK